MRYSILLYSIVQTKSHRNARKSYKILQLEILFDYQLLILWPFVLIQQLQ